LITERPLLKKEIKALNRDLNQIKKRNLTQFKFLIGWALLAIIVGSIFYFILDSENEHYLLLGTVIVYILIGVWNFTENYLKHDRQRKSIDFALENNRATSIKVVSNDYIELSEIEDDGVNYLFQLADNKILSFGGQDFYQTKKFPSNDFEIAVCYGLKDEIVLLEKYVYGEKLLPRIKITGQKKWDLLSSPKFPDPDKFIVIEGQLDDINELINGKINNPS